MFEGMKYRRRLRELEKECDKTQQIYAELRKDLSGEELKLLHYEEGSEVVPILDKINCLKSNRLCNVADRLIVPIPEKTNKVYWELSYYAGSYYLTTEGINEVRKRIRQERKDRCELVLAWIPAVVGVLGGLIGLVAVFKN